MTHKLRKMTVSVLVGGLAAVLMAPPADAARKNPTTTTTEPGYVPPPKYGQNPHPELPDEPDPYANPVEPTVDIEPTVVPVELPATNPNPGAGLAGGGDPLGDVPASDSGPGVVGGSETRPEASPAPEGGFGGILSRTGAESMPLARAGLAALTLGVGLVILARRRKVDPAAA